MKEDPLTVQGIKEENLMGMILPKGDKKMYEGVWIVFCLFPISLTMKYFLYIKVVRKTLRGLLLTKFHCVTKIGRPFHQNFLSNYL